MFHFAKQNKYKLLQPYSDDKSVDEVLLSREERTSSSSTEDVPPYYKIPSKTPYRLSCGLNIVLLCSVIALLVATWSELVIKYDDKFNNGLLKRVRQPSPILDQIHIPITTVRRNGSLLPNHPPSIYRQDPSPAVDEAWQRIGNINPIPLSSADVRAIGYDPAIVARWPEVYNLGSDAYVGRLDVFHEIHCLDMLRREAYYDHYYEDKWPKSQGGAPADHKVHISHCVYALLQSFMCTANTDPFIHYWVDIVDEPYPDFSINRQCRDFEAVLKWQQENSIPMSQYRDVIRKPMGVTPKIMSDEYKYMVGLINKDGSPKGVGEGDGDGDGN